MIAIFMVILLLGSVIWALFLLNRLFTLEKLLGFKGAHGDFFVPLSDLKDSTFLRQELPINTSGWILSKYLYSTRIWTKVSSTGRPFYAASFKVKTPAKSLLNFLDDVSQFYHWRPGVEVNSVVQHSDDEDCEVVTWRQKRLRNAFLCSDNLLAWWLEPLLDEQLKVVRCSVFEDPNYSYFIEQSLPHFHSTLYVAQPIISLENDQCLMTVITDGDVDRIVEHCLCLVEHFLLVKAPVECCQDNHEHEDSIDYVSEDQDDVVPCDDSAVKNPESATVVSRQSAAAITSSQPSANGKLKMNGDHAASAAAACHTDGEADNCASSTPTDTEYHSSVEVSRKPSKLNVLSQGLFKRNHNSSPNLQVASNGSPKRFAVLPSRSDANVEAAKSPLASVGKSKSQDSGQPEGRQESVAGYKNIVFLRSNSTDDSVGLVDYRTLANQCAADILAEVHEASNITQKPKGSTDQVQQGWIFDSTDREVVMLEKIHPGKTPCLLGKGLIKESPEAVWQAITNPYTRYVHDELLKELTVISDFGDGMKLVKLVYSTSQLLRKDNREFYLLQAERREKQKYVLSFCSVEWPEAASKECPRGKFGASGWIIDPIVSKNKHTYSMVTYISRIDLGGADTSARQQLEAEFVNKQPLAIAELREYLTTTC